MSQPDARNGSAEDAHQRFRLPSGNIEKGRSQPKRTAPKRRESQQLVKRLAFGLATFLVSLGVVALLYGLAISSDFGALALENGTTAAIALLFGCFTLPLNKRLALSPQRNLFVCLSLLAITPWSYRLGNQLEVNGMDLATGFNFIFEILLAVLFYRIAASNRKHPA